VKELLHPFLVPGSWLLTGDYYPAQGAAQKVFGSTEVAAHEQFPETLRVVGEVRDAEDPGSRPVATEFTLDLVAPGQLRFHMDSIPLGTVLLGNGFWTPQLLVFHYSSPDRRIVGTETYAVQASGVLLSSGVMFVDRVPVTTWLARLEQVR